jgi:hypothetical protein
MKKLFDSAKKHALIVALCALGLYCVLAQMDTTGDGILNKALTALKTAVCSFLGFVIVGLGLAMLFFGGAEIAAALGTLAIGAAIANNAYQWFPSLDIVGSAGVTPPTGYTMKGNPPADFSAGN